MKDYSQKQLEAGRPQYDTLHCVTFCLEQLFKDGTHSLRDEVVNGLTYEELLGALLLARDDAEAQDAAEQVEGEQ